MFDLHSLCVKGARLCSLIDTDLALQQEDLTQSRHEMNQHYYLELNEVIKHVSNLMYRAIEEMRQKKDLPRPSASDLKMDFGMLMPKLQEWMLPKEGGNDASQETFKVLPLLFNEVEKRLGVTQALQEPWEMSLLNLFKYFASLCLLLFHFQSLSQMTDEEITQFVRAAVNEVGYTRKYQKKWGKENAICGDDSSYLYMVLTSALYFLVFTPLSESISSNRCQGLSRLVSWNILMISTNWPRAL